MNWKAFPQDFLFGAATSSFQIEGATDVDGRSASIWDQFCLEEGRIADGSDGRRACEHYLRYRDDVALMKRLNLQAYRFSLAWPRVMPRGTGPINEKGITFYERLVDELLGAGIEPWVTLYHWDLPAVLGERGGWLNRDITQHFAEYTEKMVARLGDRVKHWITHNEPWCIATLGYRKGEHAPGLKDPRSGWIAAHHVLLSHGLAMQAIRSARSDLQAGIVLNLTPGYAASDSLPDQEALRRFDGGFNRWYLDPVFKGSLPSDMIAEVEEECGGALDFVHSGDLSLMRQDMDFLGINYYSRGILRGAEDAAGQKPPQVILDPVDLTDMGWEVAPQGLTDLLLLVQNEYQPKALYITENGAAYDEAPDASGRIRDDRRIRYLKKHAAAMLEALEQGVNLKGYFQWSLLDNFEWAYGYQKRFGMVWVDYETQERTPKDSAYWYRDLIQQRIIP
ncbi:MAG TPA: GH1 family beta-glucosidase [Oligoflexus sp.]|uniref:GH1 family beta-glucosidase n=1 Tax=Oligoflexus sp. TaxID=1971216 RepID=UPI002D8002DE|nr:GH1 family beta-glucosidase [Oligoflexus sp.]HET9235929.1 GH1 family beta-glucosidase [Oligoflexus sp.]